MLLLKRYIRLELETLLQEQHPVPVIGRTEALAPDVQDELELGMRQTATNTGMLFNIALNYGGRAEIVDAARRAIASGVSPERLDEQRFGEFLYTAGQPDPDLLIRTSGEMRVSNFLLWQIAYAEIWVTETLWPDFRRRDLLEASSPIRSAIGATAASSRRLARSASSDRRIPRAHSGAVTRVLSGAVLLVLAVGAGLVGARGCLLLAAVALAARRRRRVEYCRLARQRPGAPCHRGARLRGAADARGRRGQPIPLRPDRVAR